MLFFVFFLPSAVPQIATKPLAAVVNNTFITIAHIYPLVNISFILLVITGNSGLTNFLS